MSSGETGQMSAVETGQMSAAETGQMSAAETAHLSCLKDISSRVVQEAEVCSLSIESRFLELIWCRLGETGGVPGYGVKQLQADLPIHAQRPG